MIVFNNIHSGARFGNRLLQNVGISLLAKKFNYAVYNYLNTENDFLQLKECCNLGLIPYSGTIVRNNLVYYDDNSLVDLLNGPNTIDHGILYTEFFQKLDFILQYKNEIKGMFKLPLSSKNNDLFIHVRLDDATRFNPGLEYYCKCIDSISFNNGYISSDTPNHDIITFLIKKYNLQIFNDTPIKTILFGRLCNNIIISNGTFSWWIAFLSNAENIFFPFNIDVKFHPYIYLPEWIKM